MEDDAERVPPACLDLIDTVPKVYSIDSPGSANRSVADGEHERISLGRRNEQRPRSGTGTLIGESELPAFEILPGL